MSLGNLLSAEQIIPEMKATERWSAIAELIDPLVSLKSHKCPVEVTFNYRGLQAHNLHRVFSILLCE